MDRAMESGSRSLTQLTWSAPVNVGFSLQWLREVSRGTLSGEVGVRVPDCMQAGLRFNANGPLEVKVSRDSSGWLRLCGYFRGSLSGSVDASPGSSRRLDTAGLTNLLLGTAALEGGWQLLIEDPVNLGERARTTRRRFEETIGEDGAAYEPAELRKLVGTGLAFLDRILEAALLALKRKSSAQLAAVLNSGSFDSPLFDVRFSPTEDGLARFQQALEGDLSGALSAPPEEVLWQTHPILAPAQEALLELHMPFMDRREFRFRMESYEGMKVEVWGDGCLRVQTGEPTAAIERHNTYQALLAMARPLARESRPEGGFSIAFYDRRTLSVPQAQFALPRVTAEYGFDSTVEKWLAALDPAEKEIEASLTLSIPGEMAASWLDLPSIRTASFADTFADVSNGVQKCLRVWLPYAYFQDIERYSNIETARSLLVYEASRPSARRKRPDFTYDAMNPASVALAFKKSSAALPTVLQSVTEILTASGKAGLANSYHPKKAREIITQIKRGHRLFTGLLAADSLFMDLLMNLASKCREMKLGQNEPPRELSRLEHRPLADMMEAFNVKLRRLYDQQSFVSFGSLLFLEATRALHSVDQKIPPVRAVLRIRSRNGSFAERVFVNDGWRC
jgi:hypothetical protein